MKAVLNFDHLARCLKTLEQSLTCLENSIAGSIEYEVFRNAVVKSFELTLEVTGNSLRKVLKEYTANPVTVNSLTFKDLFRHAAKHGLLNTQEVQHWFEYRESRNDTTHDYGQHFAERVLAMVKQFYLDATNLYEKLVKKHGSTTNS